MKILSIAAAALFLMITGASACQVVDELGSCIERADVGQDRYLDLSHIDPEKVDQVMQKPTPEEAEELRKWVPFMCCRTNECCRKVSKSALTPVGKGTYRVEATGEIKRVHRFSRDGNTWRCACDRDTNTGKWTVYEGANTRCIFPVLELF